jgi:AcrR family transcriptional regulator
MSYWDHRKPVRRERSVDVETVSRVVVELLDGGGMRAVTLRAVAGRLGVAPASLYSRVDSVEDLFDLALDGALGEDPELGGVMAQGGVEELMVAYYRHLLRHRWACRMITQRPPRGPRYLRFSERLCEQLLDAGVEDPLAAAYALSNFALGSAATAYAAEGEPELPVDPSIAPHYARLHRQRNDADAERTLRTGLKALMSGFGPCG